jgi:hypothetical protein
MSSRRPVSYGWVRSEIAHDQSGPGCIQGSSIPMPNNEKGEQKMKSLILAVGGFCAAAAGLLVWHSKRTPNVEELAHSLEAAWADHHTSV